jgi:CRP/FNR family cyclic AMP-dependent transcriptional regulator
MAAFNAQAFLDTTGSFRKLVEYRRGAAVFSQGDACEHVMYLQQGGVKLSVRSTAGRDAVVAMIGPGDFFGEECLAGQPVRTGSATATAQSAVLLVDKHKMASMLRRHHAMADRFIEHVLARHFRIEADLADQLLNSSEKRLARTLLRLAHYGESGKLQRAIPKISQDTLAEIVGTTRSRINFFLNTFKKRGFIEYDGEFKVNGALLSALLQK